MIEIAGLILPLFGLILLGFVTARITRQPIEALGWMNTFIIYVALPALFFKLLAQTPVEQLTNWRFILTNVGVTFAIFVSVFVLGLIARGGIAGATIQGLAGAYGNIGYMGPALAILTFGEQAAIPVALIFCFENIMHFAIAPFLMAVAGGEEKRSLPQIVLGVITSIIFHPFILATAVGVGAAYLSFAPPEPLERLLDYLAQAAAPCALFAMGVILALRPLKRMPPELSFILPAKLIAHPIAMYLALSYFGDFDAIWVFTAVLLASLPTATNVFVIAQQYGVWVERASAAVLLTTVLSILSVAALLYGIKNGLLPGDLFPS
ncbi:MAG: AEC family transporter [Pseudomonadota bacterium]